MEVEKIGHQTAANSLGFFPQLDPLRVTIRAAAAYKRALDVAKPPPQFGQVRSVGCMGFTHGGSRITTGRGGLRACDL